MLSVARLRAARSFRVRSPLLRSLATKSGSKNAGGSNATKAAATQGTKVTKEQIDKMSPEELRKYIQEVEKNRKATPGATPPVTLKGKEAPYVQTLYSRSKKESGVDLNVVHTELASVMDVAKRWPIVVARYFRDAVPRKEVSALVSRLLFSEDIKKVDDIKEKWLRDEVVVNPDFFKHFLDARSELKGMKLSKITNDLVAFALHRGEANVLPGVRKYVGQILQAESKVAHARVLSAVKLNKQQMKQVEKALGSYLPPGKESFDVSFEVQEKLGGGLYIAIDNRVIDLTATSFLRAEASKHAESRA